MRSLILVASLALVGCPQTEEGPPCGEFDELFAWGDADGDGFGDPEAVVGWVCTVGAGQSTRNNDCDDAEPTTYPGAPEACDLVDNDCDGVADQTSAKVPWYLDDDADGYGDSNVVVSACAAPTVAYIRAPGDCDDGRADVNPAMPEICNEGVDDDCDEVADDDDPGLDPTTTTRFYFDGDEDGFGDPANYRDRCAADGRVEPVLNGEDCNDTDATLSPLADEVCDQVDNDCDGLLDDFDPEIQPQGRHEYFADTDGDGYGDPNATALACRPTPGIAVANARDCDDTDSAANLPKAWVLDEDDDGVGAGAMTEFQCLRPGPHRAPRDAGVDCAPTDSSTYPGAEDTCGDELDTDCDGYDDCTSCQQIKDSKVAPASGAYTLTGTFGQVQVYCDMTTDGGGWTLVSVSRAPPDDAGTSYFSDLQTLVPNNYNYYVWNGLRSEVVDGKSDLRFACRTLLTDTTMAVDLSFYDVPWYLEFTTGSDAQSCFSETDGLGADPPPARKNNRTGAVLPMGDQWGAGYLEGEDYCGSTEDFTVDFDDRGKDSNEYDGTDWGEDDYSYKCGSGSGQVWYIFFRE